MRNNLPQPKRSENAKTAVKYAGFAVVVALFASGCGATQHRSSELALAANDPGVHHVWVSRCGACHVPVEPETRSREQIEAAISRHRGRVHLADADWSRLVDFLAPQAAAPTATN